MLLALLLCGPPLRQGLRSLMVITSIDLVLTRVVATGMMCDCCSAAPETLRPALLLWSSGHGVGA
jgi:hypothetical protein